MYEDAIAREVPSLIESPSSSPATTESQPELSMLRDVAVCRHRLQSHRDMLNRVLEPRYGLLDSLFSLNVLTFDEMDQVRSETTILAKNTKLVDILIGKTTVLDFERLVYALKETRQQHVVNYLVLDGVLDYENHERPLTDEELHQFSVSRMELIDLIDTSELVDRLASDDCLSHWQRDDIRTRRTSHERNIALVDIFMRRSHTDVQKLIYWLCETKQKHIALLLVNYDVRRLPVLYGNPKRRKSRCSIM